jgi:hypothetical protein
MIKTDLMLFYSVDRCQLLAKSMKNIGALTHCVADTASITPPNAGITLPVSMFCQPVVVIRSRHLLAIGDQTSHPAPGQILIHAAGPSEPELLIPYGACALVAR